MAIGRPTRYNPEFHPEDCIRLGKLGYFAVEMASEWKIDVNTISDWRRDHPEFHVAYNRSKSERTAYYMKCGRTGVFNTQGRALNHQTWNALMRYDGHNLDERRVKLPELASCKNFSEMSACILGALACGKISNREAYTMSEVISKLAKVEEVTEMRRMLDEIQAAQKK